MIIKADEAVFIGNEWDYSQRELQYKTKFSVIIWVGHDFYQTVD